MLHDGPVSELTYVHYFFLTLWILGTLAIWPLTTWWVIRRATKLENKHRIKGAYLSLKLYVVFLMLYIIPGIVFGLLEGGNNVF